MKTKSLKSDEIRKDWYVANAEGKTLGRFASEVAKVLRGKHKPSFTPHMDMGDFVVIINAEKIRVTGNKEDAKHYFSHSGYPGGVKVVNLQEVRKKNPEKIIINAVKGMLPHNRLGRQLLTHLKVYSGELHPHAAQQPQTITF